MFTRLMRKLHLSAKNCAAAALCSTFIVATCCSFAYATPSTVTICDGDNTPITVKTSDTSVGKVLAKQGISLNEGDETNVALMIRFQIIQ